MRPIRRNSSHVSCVARPKGEVRFKVAIRFRGSRARTSSTQSFSRLLIEMSKDKTKHHARIS